MSAATVVLSGNLPEVNVAGVLSTWLAMDSPESDLRLMSESAYSEQVAYAAHLGLPAIIMPSTGMNTVNAWRHVHQTLLQSDAASIWQEGRHVLHLLVHGAMLESSVSGLSDGAIVTLRWDMHALIEAAVVLNSKLPATPPTEVRELVESFRALFPAASPCREQAHALLSSLLGHINLV